MNLIHIAQKKHAIFLAFFIPFIYRVMMSLQGIDSTDVGFCNTFYQTIFTDPDANEFCFIYYLTGFLGGIWESLFGNFGLVGFRVFETISLSAAVYFLYATFKERMSKAQSLAAIVLSMLFPVIIVTFHYDTLTYLLMALSTYLFSRYFKRHDNKRLLLAGYMIGLSFFARIVNLSFCILALVPLLIARNTKEQKIKASSSMVLGMIGGVITIGIIMSACNHMQYYIAGFQDAFSTLDRSDATHSKGEMIFRYLKSLKNILLQVFILSAILFCLYKNEKKASKYHAFIKYLLYIAIFVIALTSTAYLTTLSAALIIILAELYKQRKQQGSELYITLYLLIATLCFPMGSDIGIQGIYNWCAGLLIFPAIYYFKFLKKPILTETSKVIYVCCAMSAICKLSYKAYNESEPRFHCLTMIQPSRLNVMTEKGKAKNYQKAISAIQKYSSTNQPLLLATQASELYYATNKKPYLGHVQTIIYKEKRLEERLEERLNTRLTHFRVFPVIATLNISKEPHEVANEKILNAWMKKYHYKLVYKDNYITLYNR